MCCSIRGAAAPLAHEPSQRTRATRLSSATGWRSLEILRVYVCTGAAPVCNEEHTLAVACRSIAGNGASAHGWGERRARPAHAGA